MRIIDISRTAQDAPLYPGTPVPQFVPLSDMADGAGYNSTLITIESHVGTHADACTHFIPGGKTIDEMDLSRYYGSCRVVTFAPGLITRETLAGALNGVQRLVIHGDGRAFLSVSGAEYLRDLGILAVVTDSGSVSPPDSERAVHEILLGAEIAIVENVVLDHVDDGDYILCALPIKYGGLDGAPVRAALIEQ